MNGIFFKFQFNRRASSDGYDISIRKYAGDVPELFELK